MAVLRDGRSGIEPEPLAGLQDSVRGDSIHAGEGAYCNPVATRDAPQRIAPSDDLDLYVAAQAGVSIYSCGGEPYFRRKNVPGRRHFDIGTDGEPLAGHSVDSAQNRDIGFEAARDRVDRVT